MTKRSVTIAVAIVLVITLIGGGVVVAMRSITALGRDHFVAYFDNSNGLFRGDEVRILGVPVGTIESIEAQPDRTKITFWVDDKYKVPADVRAAVLSPQLITSRAIQLTPPYSSGPVLQKDGVIPIERTAVPVEWDDLRVQLQKLTDTLQPTQPGGVSTLGAFVNTVADNLRGQGANIRDTIIKLSQVFSALGDHSGDIFATVRNLSVLVAALHDSSGVLADLNRNLSAATALLADDPDEVGHAVADLNAVVGEATSFIADNQTALGTTGDKLASVTSLVHDSLGDVEQALHVGPNLLSNFNNIYNPTQASLSGVLVASNFDNPITFLCGAVQAASHLNGEQSAKLCAQYLAPIIKNRQYNFPPIGENLIVGATARPNERTYSEDRLRPDYVPPQPQAAQTNAAVSPQGSGPTAALPAEAPLASGAADPVTTDPSAGLPGMMVPPGSGS
jgi:phospholipid/cholesterol/gamma-HCH transport system substrate-binding protein